ncbi:MAG: FtsW/RodA/SpoVE family cell cycle protein [Prevotella sp.]|nr:FtsW/RodA/SpoVE family cell cycle protein [Prevotella sp.]
MNKISNLFKGDKVVWMIFFILCLVSIIEVFSASSFLTFKGGSYLGPLIRHTFYILLGVLTMIVIVNIPCKYFKVFTFPYLFVSFVLLIAVYFIGESTNGANRWISIAGVNFQPSELAKGALVLAVAQILSAMQTDKGADKQAFTLVMITCAFIIPLIFVENLSTAALLSFVVFCMMIVGRVPFSQLGKLVGVVVIIASLALASIMLFGNDKKEMTAEGKAKTELVESTVAEEKEDKNMISSVLHRMDTWKGRINEFFAPEVAPEDYDLDRKAQVAHANIAIVKSNGIGRGPGNSEERDFLSQAFSDFIYAIIIEEMGIAGAALVAILYVILFWRAGAIARNCANTFPAYLAMGIGMLLVVQAMFNMAVAVGMAPVTGQPLPLISRGGTSTVMNCVYIGVLLSISKSAKKRDSKKTMQPAAA